MNPDITITHEDFAAEAQRVSAEGRSYGCSPVNFTGDIDPGLIVRLPPTAMADNHIIVVVAPYHQGTLIIHGDGTGTRLRNAMYRTLVVGNPGDFTVGATRLIDEAEIRRGEVLEAHQLEAAIDDAQVRRR